MSKLSSYWTNNVTFLPGLLFRPWLLPCAEAPDHLHGWLSDSGVSRQMSPPSVLLCDISACWNRTRINKMPFSHMRCYLSADNICYQKVSYHKQLARASARRSSRWDKYKQARASLVASSVDTGYRSTYITWLWEKKAWAIPQEDLFRARRFGSWQNDNYLPENLYNVCLYNVFLASKIYTWVPPRPKWECDNALYTSKVALLFI